MRKKSQRWKSQPRLLLPRNLKQVFLMKRSNQQLHKLKVQRSKKEYLLKVILLQKWWKRISQNKRLKKHLGILMTKKKKKYLPKWRLNNKLQQWNQQTIRLKLLNKTLTINKKQNQFLNDDRQVPIKRKIPQQIKNKKKKRIRNNKKN